MAWREELATLRSEIDAVLARQLGEPVEEAPEDIADRSELYQLAESLQVAQLLVDMNEIVLSGTGRVESTSLLEYYDDEDFLFEMEDLRDGEEAGLEEDEEDDEESDEGEELRFSLLWEDDTECAVDVELGKANGRVFVLVNGEEVSQQREILETAIIDAFRSEMKLEAK